MNAILLLLFFFAVWIVWIPAVLIEKKAAGDSGLTSILPVLPVYPLVAWVMALGLDRVGDRWGTNTVGGLHIILLVWFACTILTSAYKISRQKA